MRTMTWEARERGVEEDGARPQLKEAVSQAED